MRSREDVLAAFPPLANDDNFRIASKFCRRYNCFAHAADDTSARWDPAPTTVPTRAGLYWPDGVPLLYTTSAYIAAYGTLGYEVCGTGELEAGFEKIVIYLGPEGTPTHAAKQIPNGRWTSKLGGGVDIEHSSPEVVGSGHDDPKDGVGNMLNGQPSVFLRRAISG